MYGKEGGGWGGGPSMLSENMPRALSELGACTGSLSRLQEKEGRQQRSPPHASLSQHAWLTKTLQFVTLGVCCSASVRLSHQVSFPATYPLPHP